MSTASLRFRGLQGLDVLPHPDGPRLDRETFEWAAARGLIPSERTRARLAALGCGRAAAYGWPHATPALRRLGARLIAWMFLFDDAVGEGGDAPDLRALMSAFATYDQVLAGRAAHAPRTPWHGALAELYETGRALAGVRADLWATRFATAMRSTFDGCLLEYEYRRRRHAPTLAQYRRLRGLSIGARPVFALIELQSTSALEVDDHRDARLEDLVERASLAIAWANDVFSHAKEKRASDPINLVSVIAAERALPEALALKGAERVYHQELDGLLREAVAVRARRPEWATYVEGMIACVYGNLAWSAQCQRYARDALVVSAA